MKRKRETSANSIWNKEGFLMCGLGENFTNDEGILVNDTCYEEWDKILDRMIFLWKESNEYTCARQNPYEEEYAKAHEEFTEKYGFHIGIHRRMKH